MDSTQTSVDDNDDYELISSSDSDSESLIRAWSGMDFRSLPRSFNYSNRSLPKKKTQSPEPSFVSMKSDWSMDPPPLISHKKKSSVITEPSFASMKSDWSMDPPPLISHKKSLHFRKRRLTRKLLPSTVDQPKLVSHRREHKMIKSHLRKKFEHLYEGTANRGNPTLLNEIYTELYITESESGEISNEHEVRQIETQSRRTATEDTPIKCSEIFRSLPGQDKDIRTVLTKGVAGIGKTVSVQKFILDWAEGKENQDHIDFVFPLHLCELNILHDKKFSLIQLIDLLFPKLLKPETLEQSQILFIWDGLGELRFPLKFKHIKTCTDPMTPVSVGCLLVNLLKGNLVPHAQILVTSRLKDAGLIPPEHVQKMFELHGFDDLEWEEHIRSKVRDQTIAERATVHLKSSRALYIMRSLPFFCQMASTVLEELFSNSCTTDPPLTLTEMFTHFLLIQTKRHVEKSAKSSTEEILKLGKLAWHMLEKDTLIFIETDQRETNTDPLLPVNLSDDWPMFFREQNLMGLGRMYRFTHPSVQEFLAALYVAVHYEPSKGNVMSFTLAEKAQKLFKKVPFDMHRRAVDRALKSKTGQLDMFLLFLLGISAGPSNKQLSSFFQNTSLHVRTEDVVKYIIQKIKANPLFEISGNLSRCLEELDVSLPVVHKQGRVEFQVDEDVHITPSEWSRVATSLLTSEDSSLTFDVRKYANADEAITRLLPVIKISRVLRLDEATDLSWALIASTLRSPANRIREIEIEKQAKSDINLSLLSIGMKSPNCKVEILRTPYFGHCKDSDHLLSGILLNPTHLRELNLKSSFFTSDQTVENISQILMNPDCHLQKLALQEMETLNSCKVLAEALCSSSCRLRELDLSRCYRKCDDWGLQLLSKAFRHPNFKVTVLRLEFHSIGQEKISTLFSAFQKNPSHLRELELRFLISPTLDLQELFSLLVNSCFKLETLRIVQLRFGTLHWSLQGCFLRSSVEVEADSLETLASALGSCSLKSLDLSMCGLTDSSVELLSTGLSKPGCKLEILRVTHCSITEAGAACLAKALSSNPSHMREIDLSINPVKGPGLDQLRSVLEDPATRLERLIVDGLEEQRDMETLRQHACNLTWDPNTSSSRVHVSEKEEALAVYQRNPEPVPRHPERFEVPGQIMSKEGLSGRHFFQLEWFGRWATIGMAYKDIRRKGSSAACSIGLNNNSWGIFVSNPFPLCKALHGGVEMQLPNCSPWRVGVYLDWAAGTLSFYNTTTCDKTELIHTFRAKFTQPLFLLVSISAGAKILPDVPPPVCVHDHDPSDMFRGYKDCKGCNGSKAC
ncbi:NLR family CARD domain-containing protein 3-like [Puntigrus tetrazona]|uniref:NLR family CARD domain-containing protein 3-like n=1 Tax=Puntigrus tetrazona TaxID=1606681 RepID=UPI001C8A9DE3|nr:NLR family CARD domain-containing protein 3-like [Puntigrus tetrazona]